MNRESQLGAPPRLRAPEDGIISSQRPRGPLARRWLKIVDNLSTEAAGRLARGRAIARSRRVRELVFSPGMATAQVVDTEPFNVSVRIRAFDKAQWRRGIRVLGAQLAATAALLEGELSRELVEAFDDAGIPLLPRPDELDGMCECGDFVMPCAHMAAVHMVLADAVDGEPFLLLTLRGRHREQVLAALRRHWGDDATLETHQPPLEASLPEGDWYTRRGALSPISFSFEPLQRVTPGMRELGPPPGQADLERALAPLYAEGRRNALQLAAADRVISGRARRAPVTPPPSLLMSPGHHESHTTTLTERIVNALTKSPHGIRTATLAKDLGATPSNIRSSLRTLEIHGIIYRTGRTRGTTWWLG